MRLALRRVDSSPFGAEEIEQLRSDIIAGLRELGINIKTSMADLQDVLLDYRFLEMLLAASQDPDVTVGAFAEGVRVGPAVQLLRLPALHKAKKKRSVPEQSDPLLHLEESQAGEQAWRRNYPAVATLSAEATDVLEDHARRGQVLKLTEQEARSRTQVSLLPRSGRIGRRSPGVS